MSNLAFSARTVGMGGAFSAISQNPDGVFFNPAAIAKVSRPNIISMNTKLQSDIDYYNLGVVVPSPAGALGAGFVWATMPPLNSTARDANGRIVSTGTFNYSGDMVFLNYARTLNADLSLGTGVRYISMGAPDIAGGTGSGIALDLGLILDTKNNSSFGLVVENVLGSRISWGSGAADELPSSITAGYAFRPMKRTLMAFDAVAQKNRPMLMRGGLELALTDYFTLRAGAGQNNINALNLSAGAGLRYGGVRFDYAYLLDGMLESNSTHYFSLGIEFPEKPKTKTDDDFEWLKQTLRDAMTDMDNKNYAAAYEKVLAAKVVRPNDPAIEDFQKRIEVYLATSVKTIAATQESEGSVPLKRIVRQKLITAQEYSKSGDGKMAIVEYLDVLKLDPNNITALQRLGMVYYRTGDYKNAESYLYKAYKLAPGNKDLQKLLRQAKTKRQQLRR